MKRLPRSAPTRAHTIPTLERAAALGALAVITGCDNPFSAGRHDAHASASSGGGLELATLFAAPVPSPARPSTERATTRVVATEASLAKAAAFDTLGGLGLGGLGYGGGSMALAGPAMPRHHARHFAR